MSGEMCVRKIAVTLRGLSQSEACCGVWFTAVSRTEDEDGQIRGRDARWR